MWPYDRPHPGTSQANGFSPVWLRQCRLRQNLDLRVASQPGRGHGYRAAAPGVSTTGFTSGGNSGMSCSGEGGGGAEWKEEADKTETAGGTDGG